ncbi:MAG: hypothetical protein IPK67_18940 [Planctomycetes bacterium]|nr:hypothetical protein [Planctomycetota bacterium]
MRILITSPVFPPDLGGPPPTGYPFEVVSILPASMPVRYLRAFFVVLRHARDCDVVYVNEHLALLHGARGRACGASRW